MFFLLVTSSWNDSATFDEIAHIPAGYTYLKYQDGRLNPEHPPLLKSFAALPLLILRPFENLTAEPFWNKENVNDRQWDSGNYLLYEAASPAAIYPPLKNNPDEILFWSRFPIMLLSIIFGWMLYKWVRNRYGIRVALLTLFFYATSPTVLAHSRFVTTDIGAAFGFFLGMIFFLRFLEHRDKKSLIYCGLIFGVINLFKFSLVLLIPVYFILAIFWIYLKTSNENTSWDEIGASSVKIRYSFLFDLSKIIFQLIFIGLIGLAVIYAVNIWQIWNYPYDQHVADVKYILGDYKVAPLAKAGVWLVENKVTRPMGHYVYGLLMMARRSAGGNTAYFMGEVSSKGWWSFFPTLALLKEQLAFYILALMLLCWTLIQIKNGEKSFSTVKDWISENFTLFASIFFLLFYWTSSIINPLNIGVRHVLPTFPFIFLLVARATVRWLRPITIDEPSTIFEWLKTIYETFLRPIPKYIFLSIIMLWMILEIILAFPYYLSYYNILGGGIKNGYTIATDSNYDWGQDLKRLAIWANKNHAEKIYLDYFGGGSPTYYLGDKYQGWWSPFGPPPTGSYFAISLNSLTGNQARPVGDVKIKQEDTYPWLKNKTPISRGGMSILIFKF